MKILCVSDHIDPLVYSVHAKERFKDIELVLSAGDLSLEYYSFIVSMLNKPLLFVFGNHRLRRMRFFTKDSTWTNQTYPWSEEMQKGSYGAIYIDGKTKRIKHTLIAGLGGSKQYNHGVHQYTEFQMLLRIVKMLPMLIWNKIRYGYWLDILLTHSAPKGINDNPDPCHEGFKIFLWFMRIFKPKYLIHGHIHLYGINEKRMNRYHDTTVMNAYDHVVIQL